MATERGRRALDGETLQQPAARGIDVCHSPCLPPGTRESFSMSCRVVSSSGAQAPAAAGSRKRTRSEDADSDGQRQPQPRSQRQRTAPKFTNEARKSALPLGVAYPRKILRAPRSWEQMPGGGRAGDGVSHPSAATAAAAAMPPAFAAPPRQDGVAPAAAWRQPPPPLQRWQHEQPLKPRWPEPPPHQQQQQHWREPQQPGWRQEAPPPEWRQPPAQQPPDWLAHQQQWQPPLPERPLPTEWRQPYLTPAAQHAAERGWPTGGGTSSGAQGRWQADAPPPQPGYHTGGRAIAISCTSDPSLAIC